MLEHETDGGNVESKYDALRWEHSMGVVNEKPHNSRI